MSQLTPYSEVEAEVDRLGWLLFSGSYMQLPLDFAQSLQIIIWRHTRALDELLYLAQEP